jgi:2'-5' RNA ligase
VGPTTSTDAPPGGTTEDLDDHWQVWRPEWTPERPCLYWYLTFSPDQLVPAIGADLLRAVGRSGWLDAVPAEWCHVTVAEVGFTDELGAGDAEAVTSAVAGAARGEDPVRLEVGPVQALRSAVALSVGPRDRLREVAALVREATSGVLGHPDAARLPPYRPHLSLGYVNRTVTRSTAEELVAALPVVDVRLDLAALTLAAVTRRDHGYRWEVRSQVPWGPAQKTV